MAHKNSNTTNQEDIELTFALTVARSDDDQRTTLTPPRTREMLREAKAPTIGTTTSTTATFTSLKISHLILPRHLLAHVVSFVCAPLPTLIVSSKEPQWLVEERQKYPPRPPKSPMYTKFWLHDFYTLDKMNQPDTEEEERAKKYGIKSIPLPQEGVEFKLRENEQLQLRYYLSRGIRKGHFYHGTENANYTSHFCARSTRANVVYKQESLDTLYLSMKGCDSSLLFNERPALDSLSQSSLDSNEEIIPTTRKDLIELELELQEYQSFDIQSKSKTFSYEQGRQVWNYYSNKHAQSIFCNNKEHIIGFLDAWACSGVQAYRANWLESQADIDFQAMSFLNDDGGGGAPAFLRDVQTISNLLATCTVMLPALEKSGCMQKKEWQYLGAFAKESKQHRTIATSKIHYVYAEELLPDSPGSVYYISPHTIMKELSDGLGCCYCLTVVLGGLFTCIVRNCSLL